MNIFVENLESFLLFLSYDLEHMAIKVQEQGFSFSNQAAMKTLIESSRNMVVTSESPQGARQICMQMLKGSRHPKRVVSLECPLLVENHIPFPILVQLGLENKGLLWSNRIANDDAEFLTIPIHASTSLLLIFKKCWLQMVVFWGFKEGGGKSKRVWNVRFA